MKIREWYKLKKALQKAVKNDVKITFVARENCNQDLSDVFELGIEPILKTDLHAKLYINENTAIVTSITSIIIPKQIRWKLGTLRTKKRKLRS